MYYRDEKDGISWHSDDESYINQNKPIASISLGQTRRFGIREKDNHKNKLVYNLKSGDLLIMPPGYQHTIFKETKDTKPRINLTFRVSNN